MAEESEVDFGQTHLIIVWNMFFPSNGTDHESKAQIYSGVLSHVVEWLIRVPCWSSTAPSRNSSYPIDTAADSHWSKSRNSQ